MRRPRLEYVSRGVPHLRRSRFFCFAYPAFTGWANVWRTSGASENKVQKPALCKRREGCGARVQLLTNLTRRVRRVGHPGLRHLGEWRSRIVCSFAWGTRPYRLSIMIHIDRRESEEHTSELQSHLNLV